MQLVLDEQAIFSRRHLPSWLLLSAAGGLVNAIGFVAHARFVTHVTGAISTFGMSASAGKLAIECAVLFGCLVLGAVSAAPIVGTRRRALPLVIVATILSLLAVLGTAGVFGKFGSDVETRNFVFLSLLSFAMGLQNASVASATRMIVRSTHMTGVATDLGLHLGAAIQSNGDARRASFRQAALRAGKIGAFMIGVTAGAIVAAKFGFLALLLPALAVACATRTSFR